MRIAYFDCFSGAAGDMILGAFLAAGLRADQLRQDLTKLNLTDYDLQISDIKKQGFAAKKVDVTLTAKPAHRHLHHITKIIDSADLPATVKTLATKIFTRLAEAEAKVHGTTIEKVHFHEVGAIDAIIDIVGASLAMHRLRIEKVLCSPIPTGNGIVHCDHGAMPIPAPATAELLRGIPLAPSDEQGELTTPTAAAILTTIADSFGAIPAMRITEIGYGAGTRDGVTRPNVLRLLLGESIESTGAQADEIITLEVNLDDATGQEIGHAFDALFAAGALDVFTTPIQMKKNRPGILLSALASPEHAAACEQILFDQTPTFGIRRHTCTRTKLDRQFKKIATPFGEITIKLGLRDGRVVIATPEYEDCSRAAQAHHRPLREVIAAARKAWDDSPDNKGHSQG